MYELPAESCFLSSLAHAVPFLSCLFGCTKLVCFFMDAFLMVFFGQNGLMQERMCTALDCY